MAFSEYMNFTAIEIVAFIAKKNEIFYKLTIFRS